MSSNIVSKADVVYEVLQSELLYRPLSPELVKHAQLVVCGLAKDPKDAELLLSALGLKGA